MGFGVSLPPPNPKVRGRYTTSGLTFLCRKGGPWACGRNRWFVPQKPGQSDKEGGLLAFFLVEGAEKGLQQGRGERLTDRPILSGGKEPFGCIRP